MGRKASPWYSKFKDLTSSVHGRRRSAGSNLKCRAGDGAHKDLFCPIEVRLSTGDGEEQQQQLWERDFSSMSSYEPEALKTTVSIVDDSNEAPWPSYRNEEQDLEASQEDDYKEEHKRRGYAEARRQRRVAGLSFSASLPPGIGSHVADGVVSLVKQSWDPFQDFRDSMEQVVREHWTWPELEELLYCYLSLNSVEQHECIRQAFQSVVLGRCV